MIKKILIAGGAGFIGKNLSKHLINNIDNYVICVDNFISSDPRFIKELVSDFKNFEFINLDVSKKIDIHADEIYHLASPASPFHYQKNPIETIKSNLFGSINLLELSYKYNSKILFTSTSEIYGDPLVHPQTENYFGNVNTVGPRSSYDESKRCSETIFYEYQKKFNIDAKIVRIFNTYGPMMDINDGRVISNFIISAIKNEDIIINGDGSQTRSFCYIDDLIVGLQKIMSLKNFFGPINIGNDKEIKILDVANYIISNFPTESKIIFNNKLQDDPLQRRPDLSLAKEYIDWRPNTSFENGIQKTYEYFKSILK